ncbi:hypothetical protein PIB30_115566, partial [Stylosanthes scabra]|nr:hypothetical protein [Stylosanthes scabra]
LSGVVRQQSGPPGPPVRRTDPPQHGPGLVSQTATPSPVVGRTSGAVQTWPEHGHHPRARIS